MTTTSLDLSKKLAETAERVGYKLPESYFVWKQAPGVYMDGVHYFLFNNFVYLHPEIEPPRPERIDNEKIVRTYSLDELYQLLPIWLTKDGLRYCVDILLVQAKNQSRQYNFIYSYKAGTEDEKRLLNGKYYENISDACCELLIWLLDNNYLKGEK
jgi:hypothetical protein